MLTNAMTMTNEVYAKMSGLAWYLFTVSFMAIIGVTSINAGDVSMIVFTAVIFAFVEVFHLVKEVKSGKE